MKKKKFKVAKEVKALARKTKIPANKVIPNKKKEDDFCACYNCVFGYTEADYD